MTSRYLGRFHEQPSLLPIWVDALTFLVSGVAHLATAARRRRAGRDQAGVGFAQTWRDIVDGLRFIRSNPLVRGVMIGLAGGLIGGGMIVPLGPLFARDVLGGGDSTFGFSMTAFGVGAAIGVVTLLVVQRRLPRQAVFTDRGRRDRCGDHRRGRGVVADARVLPRRARSARGAGCAYVTGFTVLQESVADDMRGRTFATLYTVVRLCLLLSLTIGPFVSSGARLDVERDHRRLGEDRQRAPEPAGPAPRAVVRWAGHDPLRGRARAGGCAWPSGPTRRAS